MREQRPIAVLGLACRFPGARDSRAYWAEIEAGRSAIAEMPAARFHRERYYDPEIGAYGKSYTLMGGLIEDHPFDARSFRLPPKVLESTDVAHLWALEVAKETFADAGLDPFALPDTDCGVIVGHARGSQLTADMAFATAVESMVRAADAAPALAALPRDEREALKARVVEEVHTTYPRRTEDGGIGTMASGLSGLIAHTFGLTGRHMVVDAACASSFAALDLACHALEAGTMSAALVGGASYSQEISVIMFAQSRALSPDGSYPFDRRANGFVSSDGVGFVLLMPLDEALAQGRRVRAVIRGIGGSCDGKGRALWSPRREGQVLAMERAYAGSGVAKETIGLIEAHATGTGLGDRTEVEALAEVFGPALPPGRRLPLGSVKGNIGHCREAAGIAGLIKAVLSVESGVLPPTGGFTEPNPDIPWDSAPVEVLRAPRPWPKGQVRRAGVNAFGIGGLNYHVVLEQPPEPGPPPARPSRRRRPLDVAIVGVGGRFPGAASPAALFGALSERRSLLSEVPANRWPADIYWQPGDRAPYRTYAKRGGFITDYAGDWRRHKVPPKLVERNDPLQFMVLESALDALEDAGLDVARYAKDRVAVIMGSVFGSDFALSLSLAIRAEELGERMARLLGRPELQRELVAALRAPMPTINEDSSGSFSASTLASRTAKTLDLMGPTYTLDAACASSLAALEAAADLLRAGDVDLAITGGGDRSLHVQRFEAYSQFYGLSRGGVVRPFDAAADGFLPGEGACVLVLMRAEDARREGRHIYAVVRGVGSAADGERRGMHRSSPHGLALAMRRALDRAELDPQQVGFIECHGAGTALGDATETAAVRAVYRPSERERPLYLGSVKSTVGHLQGAAAATAVLKAALVLDRGQLPPTAGFEHPAAEHHFEEGLAVNTAVLPYLAGETGAVAVSSMGLAGINYHAVLTKDGAALAPKSEAMTKNGATDGPLHLLEGEAAARLLAEPGFAEFWAEVRPHLATLLEGLWVARGGVAPSTLPVQEATTALPQEVVEVARPSKAEVQDFLVKALCQETGYPPELITVDADLEADLGIDTVKQAQVLGKVRDHFHIRTSEKLSLRDFPTLSHILKYVDSEIAARAAAGSLRPKSSIPKVDLTERRSKAPGRALLPSGGG